MKKTTALPTVALLLAAAAATGCPTAVGTGIDVGLPAETAEPPMAPPTDTADDGSAALTPVPDDALYRTDT